MNGFRIKPACRLALTRFDPDDTGTYKKNEDGKAKAKAAQRRFNQIKEFEELLTENGTAILKCFLHISKDEQKARLEARIRDPEKRWKWNSGDLEERKLWDE